VAALIRLSPLDHSPPQYLHSRCRSFRYAGISAPGMTQPFRLASGGLIDRSRLLSFTFNGRRLQGYEGDTLASALLANGIRVVGRSFKYHRPRGIVTAGADEPNALVHLDRARTANPTYARPRRSFSTDLLHRARTAGPQSTSTWEASTTGSPLCFRPAFITKRLCGRHRCG